MDKEQIKALLERYAAGACTPEEKALAEHWFYTQKTALPSEQEMEADLEEVWLSVQPHTPVRRLWPRIAAAASILVILSAGGYLLFKPKAVQQIAQVVKNDIAPGHNQATLTLANGKKIILTRGLSGVLATQGNTTIQASNNHIAYNNSQQADQLIYNTLSTARGEQSPYPLVLADGTKVWLNAESSITFPTVFNQKERIVKLTGEAYFEVKHNAAQPFEVQTANQTIEDIGTQFDVKAYSDEATATTLVEGSVKVNNSLLKPGEQFANDKIQSVNTERYTAWKNGDFDFEGDNIQTIMHELSRWYNIEVSYEATPTTGFSAEISRGKNISAVLHMLERTRLVHFKIEGRRVTVIK